MERTLEYLKKSYLSARSDELHDTLADCLIEVMGYDAYCDFEHDNKQKKVVRECQMEADVCSLDVVNQG